MLVKGRHFRLFLNDAAKELCHGTSPSSSKIVAESAGVI